MHIYLSVFKFFITFKMALDMLCMSGSGGQHLNELRVEVDDGNWVTKLEGRTVNQISLNKYFQGGVFVIGGAEDTFSLLKSSQTISYWNCYQIAIDINTVKVIIGCRGDVNTIQMPAYRNGIWVIKEHHTPRMLCKWGTF